MQKVKQQSKSTEISPVRWILTGLAVVTLYFQTNLNDPFNSPKFWALLISASWLLGYLFKFKINLEERDKNFYNKVNLIVFAYLFFLLISSLFSYNKNVSFLGETFRRNGTLTYVGFAVFFLVAAKFVSFANIKMFYIFVSALFIVLIV